MRSHYTFTLLCAFSLVSMRVGAQGSVYNFHFHNQNHNQARGPESNPSIQVPRPPEGEAAKEASSSPDPEKKLNWQSPTYQSEFDKKLSQGPYYKKKFSIVSGAQASHLQDQKGEELFYLGPKVGFVLPLSESLSVVPQFLYLESRQTKDQQRGVGGKVDLHYNWAWSKHVGLGLQLSAQYLQLKGKKQRELLGVEGGIGLMTQGQNWFFYPSYGIGPTLDLASSMSQKSYLTQSLQFQVGLKL